MGSETPEAFAARMSRVSAAALALGFVPAERDGFFRHPLMSWRADEPFDFTAVAPEHIVVYVALAALKTGIDHGRQR
jgi:hypothetical protein